MISKTIGTAAELKVAAYLTELGFSVFKEMGDSSRVDLITEWRGKLTKVQVKYVSKAKGDAYPISLEKSGPGGYSYIYSSSDFDILAVVLGETGEIAWLTFDDFLNRVHLSIRYSDPKNNQKASIHKVSEFTDFNRVKRYFMNEDLTGTVTQSVE